MLVQPIVEQQAHFLNQIDCRDLRTAGLEDVYTVTNTSSWLGDLFLLLDPELQKNLGFIIDISFSVSNLTNIIYLMLDGIRFSSAGFGYGATYPFMCPDGKFSLYAYNSGAANVLMTFWFTYLPKTKYPYTKPLVGDFSRGF